MRLLKIFSVQKKEVDDRENWTLWLDAFYYDRDEKRFFWSISNKCGLKESITVALWEKEVISGTLHQDLQRFGFQMELAQTGELMASIAVGPIKNGEIDTAEPISLTGAARLHSLFMIWIIEAQRDAEHKIRLTDLNR